MRIRSTDTCALAALLLGLSVPLAAQQQTPAERQAAQTPAAPPLQPKAARVPDYPDPRTLTIGVFYWLTIPGTGANLETGHQAFDLETLKHLGPDHKTPGIFISIPITRTAEIKFEGWETKGDGNQTATKTLDLFSTTINPGDYLATQYQIKAGKLYLDDLLWPYKFPVSRFRLKSLWEVQWISVSTTIDAPLVAAVESSSGISFETATGSRQVILPSFGLAAEYALTPHTLFRAAATGFGLPHRADIWDAEATLSYRRRKWEILAGFKAMHFKTTPQQTEFIADTLSGGFVGVNWHF
ncbi:MAG TPA: hypothetical protein VG345_15890 [Bryobacteraceae bacterium]|nr:hypothetical protein [Bryobacteraceae bacterium]